MNNKTTALDAKIEARNFVNREALAHSPAMLDALRPFVGTKIINADGSIRKRVYDLLPKSTVTPQLHWWYVNSGYSLRAEFKTCVSYGEYSAMYAEIAITLGRLENGVLAEVPDNLNDHRIRTDYTADEVVAARAELREAQKRLSEAQSKLHFFGEYDR